MSRSLLIIHRPGAQALSDWTAVRGIIATLAPDIDVRIETEEAAGSLPSSWHSDRPLLVLAIHELDRTWIGGGKLYAGIDYDKVIQHDRLAAAGIPTPRTKRLGDVASFNASARGEFAIVKPAVSHLGAGVRLVRTADLPRFVARLTADQRHELIVQPFIEHADLAGRPFEFRVLAFLGRLLYASRNAWPVARAPLAQIAASPRGLIASNDGSHGRRVRALTDETNVIALALAAARVFPELPTVAVDIIRNRNTGELSVLEVNPKGESWHLSSDFAVRTFEPQHRAALYMQHDALNVVADALIEWTRNEAA